MRYVEAHSSDSNQRTKQQPTKHSKASNQGYRGGRTKAHSPGLLAVLPVFGLVSLNLDTSLARAALLFAREVLLIAGTGILPFSSWPISASNILI
jgi:hypothetical protein